MNMKPNEVTLEDFEVRYANLRRDYPGNPSCSVDGCPNPVDVTEGMGVDTSCAYHRLLFDWWFSEVVHPDYTTPFLKDRKSKRRAFKRWIEETGRDACDKIVLEMARVPINWSC